MWSWLRSRPVSLAGMALCVGLLCWMSSRFFWGDPGISAVWPANAVALVYILRGRRGRRESLEALAVTAIAMVAANVAAGRALPATLLFPVANVVEIGLAAWFMRSVAMPMTAPRHLGQFLLGGVVAGPLASTLLATGVAAGLLDLSGQALVDFATGWLMSDALGMAIIAPFLLSLTSEGHQRPFRIVAGPVLVFVVSFILCWQMKAPILFLAFPLVTLAVINDRGRGGALAVFAVAVAVIGTSLLGEGPAPRLAEGGLDPSAVLQVFFAALVITAHPLAAVLTQLDQFAARQQTLRLAAEDESAAKSRMLGQVGIDIRSPLSGVVTVAEMLKSGRLGDLNPRQIELLTRIAESGAEIEALSREMTALARGEEPVVRGAAVAKLITEAVDASRFRARRQQVEIEALGGDPSWRADIEPSRLRRILIDALTYAIEGAANGGRIRVVAALTPEDGLEIAVDDSGSDSLARRVSVFMADCERPASTSGAAFDRQELRRVGGDLTLAPGGLGGARLTVTLRRQSSRFPEQIQHRA